MIGAVSVGMVDGKFGRKNIIVACRILSSLVVAMNGFVYNTTTFFICLLLIGIGLGGAILILLLLANGL